MLFLFSRHGHCISENSSLLKNACRTGSSKKHELKSKQKLKKKLSFYTKVKDAVTSLNAKKTISKKYTELASEETESI